MRTDGWIGYAPLASLGYRHMPVAVRGDHAKTDVHLPMIHLAFSNLDAWLLGTHHGVSPQHFQAYLKLKVGQDIEYFEAEENRLLEASIIELKRTRVLVKNRHDGKLWNIPFYHINLDHADTAISGSTGKLDRNSLKVGDKVAFKDSKGERTVWGLDKARNSYNPATVTFLFLLPSPCNLPRNPRSTISSRICPRA